MLGHVGVLAALTDAGLATGVREWWGCSGGALCALLGALGVSVGWMRDCVAAMEMRLLGGVEAEMVSDYFQMWGVNSGRLWIEYIGRVLDTWEPGISAWTFADLARRMPAGSRYCVIATNLTAARLDVFSVETTPTVLLLDALRASCAVPLFYTPWRSESGDVYCDGAVMEQFPWGPITDKAGTLVVVCSDTALGRQPVTGPITGVTDYVARIIQAARRRTLGSSVGGDQRSVTVRNWIAVNNRTVGVLDFGLDEAGRVGLFEEGLRAGQGWVSFRQSRLTELSEQSSCSPQENGDPDSGGTFPCGENRTSDSHLPHREEDGPCPSHRPDTGRPRVVRRWSL